jgi:hypothetical protein
VLLLVPFKRTAKGGGGEKGSETELFVLENTAAKTVKRTKHREGSADEDSSARAERLKAKNFG